MFAQPYGTYSPSEAEQALAKLQAEHGLATIVVGWPVMPDGEEGSATAFVRPFIGRLRTLFPSVEVVQWDEVFTSKLAEQAIRASGARRKARRDKARVDAAAAAVILQEYLDSTGKG
jgi:putative Holliday junction resolvase